MRGGADYRDAARAKIAKLLAGAALVAIATTIPMGMSAAIADTSPTQTTSGGAVQAQVIQAEVAQALAGIDPSLTGAARNAAIEQALQQLAQTNAALGPQAISILVTAELQAGVSPAIVVDATLRGTSLSGMPAATAIAAITTSAIQAGAPATDVTAQVIATGNSLSLSTDSIGQGLGTAAAQLQALGLNNGANAIAQTVADEGTGSMGTAFSQAVIANGGSQALASLGTANPQVSGNQSGNSLGNNDNGQGNGGGLPPCASPSCT